jgi:HEPN domain-containing protein
MKPTTVEWIDKAEGDIVTAQMSYRPRKSPNYDAACFHAQQCVEKYLKARLEEAGLNVPKTQPLRTVNTDPTDRTEVECPRLGSECTQHVRGGVSVSWDISYSY